MHNACCALEQEQAASPQRRPNSSEKRMQRLQKLRKALL